MEQMINLRTLQLSKTLNIQEDPLNAIQKINIDKSELRVSIIDKAGVVIYDNTFDPSTLDNHSDRPEIEQAFKVGTGSSSRFSSTLGQRTYYYAILLDNDTVLRTAKTTNDFYNIFKGIFPIVGLCIFLSFILCHLLSVRIVRRVVEPINNIDFKSENINVYDELSPLIRTIKNQKDEITEQINNLESRTNTIKAIAENMNEGILLLDNKKNILLLNKGVLKLLSKKDENFVGKNAIELIRDLDVQNAIDLALNGKASEVILNSSDKIIEILFTPVYQGDSITGVVILLIDITRKSNNEKLRREFSANVSHELKTPLTTILGLSELIYNDMVQPNDYKEFGGKIKTESERLLILIDNIIKISQLDENLFTNTFENINITSVINDVVKSLDNATNAKGVTIFVDSNNETINGNKQYITELLYNIIENSVKYNKENGKVFVTTSTLNNKVKIEIRDTGIGIDENEQDRIFERFYRVDKSRSKKTGGSGLGLSIVKHIVESHNGQITVESTLNVGTTFKILI